MPDVNKNYDNFGQGNIRLRCDHLARHLAESCNFLAKHIIKRAKILQDSTRWGGMIAPLVIVPCSILVLKGCLD